MKIDLKEKLEHINEYWSPKIIGSLNGQVVKLAKLKGEFVWHHHEHEDELFMVLGGRLSIEFRDRVVELEPMEICIIPKGTEHRPVAENEVSVLLFEPSSTLNTGNITNEFTKRNLEHL